ncbi:zinc finger protein 227-like isoform X2 [Calliphora vicina]|uniref:zinc finger protein 227-like isoform X2 n=1 Tax=Calliphora vicina TaxID=7373 RepID=UPI00325BD1A2
MKNCCICKKKQKHGSGSFFGVPKDERRLKWSKICRMEFTASSLICMDHFAPQSIIKTGRNALLIPSAVPIMPDNRLANVNSNSAVSTGIISPHQVFLQNFAAQQTQTGNTFGKNFKKPSDPKRNSYEDQKGILRQNLFNINNNAQPAEIQTSPILQIPLFKSDSKAASTQTNTRYCGTIQVSEFADEYRINCFYCCKSFPMEKWKIFRNHLKKQHFEDEEAFKISKYVSDDHDYTTIGSPTFTPIEVNPVIEQTLVIEADTLITYILESLDSMESTQKAAVAEVITPNFHTTAKVNQLPKKKTSYLPHSSKNQKKKPIKKSYSIKMPTYDIETEFNVSNNTVDNEEQITSSFPSSSKNEKKKPLKKRTIRKSSKNVIGNTGKSKQKVLSSGVLYLQSTKRHPSTKTALSRCLKRSNTIETIDPIDIKEEFEPSDDVESFQQVTTTELSFEYTPRDIIDFLLDNMKNYAVLWEYDEHPFNEDYYEAIEELCALVNSKWSMNIDNLKMRRSVNRVLRFYCSVYPLENVENIDQFTSFYDKCAAFLPKSVNDIAYARCSHCYRCYRNDSDLKGHLLEEQKHLQWPYKCIQCKECFRDNDEFEFHKRLPHYKEVFRCEQCSKKFLHRNKYNRHMLLHQIKESDEPGKYVCNICNKAFKASGELRNHLVYHGEKKHKCHLCPKAYFTNALLRRHIMSHNNEYDLMCEVCGKGFIFHNNLREHMKKHTGAKVTCNICNLQLRKSSLMRHLRTVHVACEGTIESTFRARCHNYKRILRPMQKRYRFRNKYKAKTYFCKICDIQFDGYKFIVEHNKEFHSDYTKLPCKICSTEFKQKLNLNRHYRQKHMLHSYQVYKLVELDEDVNAVLAIKVEELEKLTETLAYSLNGPSSSTAANKSTAIIKTDPSPDEIYIEEERLHSDTIQDQIMEVADNIAPHEIKVDDDHYMNDFFTNLLK